MATIFIKYIYWHFTIAPAGIFEIMGNYLKSTWHKFLIPQHFKTLFAPWHRRDPSQLGAKKSRSFGDIILDKIVDGYIRLVAAVIRLAVILTGLVTEVFVTVVFLALFVVWMLWPVVGLFLIFKGIALLMV